MRTRRFHIDAYLSPDEAFHFARKSLARRFPARAHDHDYFEVFLIETGRTQHWINGRLEMLERGHLAYIRDTDVHAFCADADVGCRIINVMFRAETAHHLLTRYAPELKGRFFGATGPQPESVVLQGHRLTRAIRIADELQTAKRSLARIEEFLLGLCNRVAEPTAEIEGQVPKWFADAMIASRNPHVFRRGAAGFIDAAGRSHEHVCRTCKNVLGITPSAHVNRVRIEHAARLLASGEMGIAAVAEECGLANISHFYKLFRAQCGLTPRQYRLRHSANPFDPDA